METLDGSEAALTVTPGEPSGSQLPQTPKRSVLAAKLGAVLHLLGITVLWLVVLSGAILLALGSWIIQTFGYITPDHVLMNLAGAGGEGGGGAALVWDAAIHVLVVPVIAVLLLGLSLRAVRRRPGMGARFTWVRPLTATVIVALVLAVPATGLWSIASALQVRGHFAAQDPSLDLADYYVVPQVTQPDGPPTNLVLIYLESIENSFSNEDVFGTDMLSELTASTDGWDSVPALKQYDGGGWTMSGIVSTQCGVPLRMPPSSGISGTEITDQAIATNYIEVDRYLSGAVCLGDVLKEIGYQNVFLGGARTTFASKGQFLESHGYDTVLGLDHWLEQGETEVSEAWGLSDRRLFENARIELDRLEASGEPFSLTMLTLDTHEPAHFFEYCPSSDLSDMTDVTRCSMSQVAQFVQYMDQQGYLENTTVVVMGDHLKFAAAKNSFFAELKAYPDRTIFNRLHPADGQAIAEPSIDQLSMLATILDSMGLELADGRAGLGVSAYVPGAVPGTMRMLPEEQRDALVRSRSADFYASLWGEPIQQYDGQPRESSPAQ